MKPGEAADYRRGTTQALQQLVGLTIRETGGQGNPRVIRALLQRLLEEDV